jgi:hypothetical protein
MTFNSKESLGGLELLAIYYKPPLFSLSTRTKERIIKSRQ